MGTSDGGRIVVRDVSLDAIRSLALFLIVLVHVTASGFYTFSPAWKAVVAYGSAGRMGVPLFFMVSGALLLPRESTVQITMRRIRKIGIPLVFWSVCYLLWLQGRASMSYHWAVDILSGPVAIHLWFLYTMMGAYLFIPMFSAFHRYGSTGNSMLAIAAWFVGASALSIVPTICGRSFFGVDLSFMPLYAGYVFLGAFLANQPIFNKRDLAFPSFFVTCVCVAATAFFTWKWSLATGKPSELFYAYSSPTVSVGSAALFIAVRCLFAGFDAMPAALSSGITWFASCTFGIYLSHLMLLLYGQERGINFMTGGVWVGCLAVTIATVVLCAVGVTIVQQIPYVRAICPAS